MTKEKVPLGRKRAIRLDDETDRIVTDLAAESGLTWSQIARILIRGNLQKVVIEESPRVALSAKDRQLIAALASELSVVGNNVNQIARALHSTGEFDRSDLLKSVERLSRDLGWAKQHLGGGLL